MKTPCGCGTVVLACAAALTIGMLSGPVATANPGQGGDGRRGGNGIGGAPSHPAGTAMASGGGVSFCDRLMKGFMVPLPCRSPVTSKPLRP